MSRPGTTEESRPATADTSRRRTLASAINWRTVLARPGLGVVALLVVIFVIMAIGSRNFLTTNNLFNIATQMVYVFILAIGMTVVLITGGIDLSVGAVLGLSAGVMAQVLNNGAYWGVAFIAALATGAGLGLINGLIITRLGIPDFVATLAMLGIASGLLYLWTGGIPLLGYMNDLYRQVGGQKKLFWYITEPMIISVAVAILIAGVLRYTSAGRHAYAVGSNSASARVSGVSVRNVKVMAYVLSGLLAALTGILLAGQTTTIAPNMGSGYEIRAIAAAVIGGATLAGGRGRVMGAFLGALTLTVAQNVINLTGVSSTWEQVVIGAILLIAIFLDRGRAFLYQRSIRRAVLAEVGA
jgi:ribose transport system permease protein